MNGLNTEPLLPVTENVLEAAAMLHAASRSPIPSVILLREIADTLTWIAGQVEALEKRDKAREQGGGL